MKRLKKLKKDIEKKKKKLMDKAKRTGLHEDFGQKEVRELEEKHEADPWGEQEEREMDMEIRKFEDWASELDLDDIS